MAARRSKNQARRSGAGKRSGILWLAVGLAVGGLAFGYLHFKDEWRKPLGSLLPTPDPDATAKPASSDEAVAEVPEKPRTKFDFYKLLPEKEFAAFKAPEPSIPKSIGHHREWLAAIRRNDPAGTMCRFDYAGPLAEAVLLGTVAYRVGKAIEWDAKQCKVTNAPEAERYVRGEYRKGWGM